MNTPCRPRPCARLALTLLGLACGPLAGCAGGPASSPQSSVASSADGADGADGAAATDGAEAPSAGGEARGARAESEAEPADASMEDDTFDTLLGAAAAYDTLLSEGAVDCDAAGRLVARICYLAERVCAVEGVSGPGQSAEADHGARCDEARARCEHAEQRLGAACGAGGAVGQR